MSHWEPALRSMQAAGDGIYGPRSFLGYLREHGVDPSQLPTAAELSVDTRSQLSAPLAARDTMVLRLGRATDGPGTQFALVSVPDRLDDFFIDEMRFPADDRETVDYTPDGDDTRPLGQEVQDMLDVYRSLPTFSETGFVNVALSTGLLSRALDLDAERIGTAPTTVASTRRNGERVLLVIEAKCGARQELAKHKLAYPALAAGTPLSLDVDRIIPVYLRARPAAEGVRYSIYECSQVAENRPCLAELHVVDDTHYTVRRKS